MGSAPGLARVWVRLPVWRGCGFGSRSREGVGSAPGPERVCGFGFRSGEGVGSASGPGRVKDRFSVLLSQHFCKLVNV